MQSVAPAATRHYPTGEFIDNHNFAIADDVVDVFDKEFLGLDGVEHIVGPGVFGIKQVLNAEHVFGLNKAFVGKQHVPRFFIDFVVLFAVEGAGHLCRLGIFFAGALDLTGDNERRPGFINQNGVDFVDDAKVEGALHHIGHGGRHVVTQVVKAKFAVGSVGNVATVILTTLRRVHALLNQPHAEAEKAMDLPHPLGVAPGQVIVHRDDVNAFTTEGIQVGGQGGDQGLTFPGFHFGDLPVVQHHATDQLHVKVAHAQYPLRRLTHHGKGFGQQIIQGFALVNPLSKFGSFTRESVV